MAALRVMADAIADHISQGALHKTGVAGETELFRFVGNLYVDLIAVREPFIIIVRCDLP